MHALSVEDAREILKESRFGTLSLAKQGHAYCVPLYYALDDEELYFHCHPGLKDEFMDATEDACFTVIHMANKDLWESVHAFGTVERLTLTDDLEAAKNALFKVPFPPAEGNYPGGTPVRTSESVYYARMNVREITGKASHHTLPKHITDP